jgi:hypothetical protein
MTTHTRKGSALPLAIGIVAVLVIAAGVVYYFGFRQGEEGARIPGNEIQGKDEEVNNTAEEGETKAPGKTFMVQLQAQNNSGMTGTAYFSEAENAQTKVVLLMAGVPSSVARPVHIHAGGCPTPGKVEFPLADIVEGKSETLIPVDFPRLADRLPLAVNVHKSFAELTQYVACGDIAAENLGVVVPASPEPQ